MVLSAGALQGSGSFASLQAPGVLGKPRDRYLVCQLWTPGATHSLPGYVLRQLRGVLALSWGSGPYHSVSLSLFRGLQYAARNLKGDEPMVALRCPCGESTKSGESSGGSEGNMNGCISTIWKRAKPTPSRLCTAPRVVGGSSAGASR